MGVVPAIPCFLFCVRVESPVLDVPTPARIRSHFETRDLPVDNKDILGHKQENVRFFRGDTGNGRLISPHAKFRLTSWGNQSLHQRFIHDRISVRDKIEGPF